MTEGNRTPNFPPNTQVSQRGRGTAPTVPNTGRHTRTTTPHSTPQPNPNIPGSSVVVSYRSRMPDWVPISADPSKETLDNSAPKSDQQLTVNGEGAALPIIYGEQRIGGKIIALGTINSALIIAVAFCVGPVEAITALEVNDKALSTYVDTATGSNTISAELYLGYQTTASPILTTALTNFSDVYPNICYAVLKLEDGSTEGFPNITAQIKGKKVYDPRNTAHTPNNISTTDTNVWTNPTWSWSQNPALCLADLIRSTAYGLGETIDYTSLKYQADFNDSDIDDFPNNEISRTLNIIVDNQQLTADWIETLRGYSSCFVVPSTNGYQFIPDKPIGYGINCSASDTSYLAVTYNSSHEMSNEMSIEVTVKPISPAAGAVILSKGTDYSLTYNPAGTIRFAINNSAIYADIPKVLSTTSFTTISVGIKKNGGFVCCIDGEPVPFTPSQTFSTATTISINHSGSGSPIYIGRSAAGTNYFNGVIDEVRLWNRGRELGEVQRDYARQIQSKKDWSLVLHLPMNEGLGRKTYQNSPSDGGLIIGEKGIGVATGIGTLNKNDWCVEFNCSPLDISNDPTAYEYFFSKLHTGSGGDYGGLWIGCTNRGNLFVQTKRIGEFAFRYPHTTDTVQYTLSPGNNYHIAATYSSSAGKIFLYLNGNLIYSEAISSNPFTADLDRSTMIGGTDVGDTETGLIYAHATNFSALTISELRIWNYNRTATEINTYKSTSVPTSSYSSMMAYYKFTETAGDTRADVSAHGNILTLHTISTAYVSNISFGYYPIYSYSLNNLTSDLSDVGLINIPVSSASGKPWYQHDGPYDFFRFDSDNVIAGTTKFRKQGIANVPTIMEIEYTDRSAKPWRLNYEEIDASNLHGGVRRVSSISMPGINRASQAHREGVERYNNIVSDTTLNFSALDETLQVQIGSPIQFHHPVIEVAGTNFFKPYRITALKHKDLGRWDIGAIEYDALNYSKVVVAGGGMDDTNLPPGATSPIAPTDLTATEILTILPGNIVMSGMNLVFKPPIGFSTNYIKDYRLTVDEGPIVDPSRRVINTNIPKFTGTGGYVSYPTEFKLNAGTAGQTHTIAIATVALLNGAASPTSLTGTCFIQGLTAPPIAPTNLVLTEIATLGATDIPASNIGIDFWGVSPGNLPTGYPQNLVKSYIADLYAEPGHTFVEEISISPATTSGTTTTVAGTVYKYHMVTNPGRDLLGSAPTATYSVSVKAVNASDRAGATVSASITLAGSLNTYPPTNLSGFEAGGKIYMHWQAPIGSTRPITSYEIKHASVTDVAALSSTSQWDFAETLAVVDALTYTTIYLPLGNRRFFVKSINSANQKSTTFAYIDIQCDTDNNAFSVGNIVTCDVANSVAVSSYTCRGDINTYWITDYGGNWGSSPENLTQTIASTLAGAAVAVPRPGFSAQASMWVSDQLDVGVIPGTNGTGIYQGYVSISAPITILYTTSPAPSIASAITQTVEMRSNPTGTWVPAATGQLLTARYLRCKIAINSTLSSYTATGFLISGDVDLNFDTPSRDESGTITTGAIVLNGENVVGALVRLTRKYNKVKSIQLTIKNPLGTDYAGTNIIAVYEDVTLGEGDNMFTVYVIDVNDETVAGIEVSWLFRGV